jgi:SagB-type dehydrogenase family enzyme
MLREKMERKSHEKLPEPSSEITRNIGDIYQQLTKYHRNTISGGGLDWFNRPKTYKIYENPLKEINLPNPDIEGGEKLFKLIKKRRSIRNYSKKPISIHHLSQLLWASQGITHNTQGYELRASPSAGALYPIETYLVINNIETLDQGIYHYRIQNHQLEFLKSGDFRIKIAQAALEQMMAAYAAIVFVWTAFVDRSKWKYRQRGYRYIYLDAGHIAENLSLAAESLGLGSCSIGALFDNEINELLEIDGEKETVIYLCTVGYPL